MRPITELLVLSRKNMPTTFPSDEMHHSILQKFTELYSDVFDHDGYGDIRVEVRLLSRGQKEVILHCGKQYRYVVDFNNAKKA